MQRIEWKTRGTILQAYKQHFYLMLAYISYPQSLSRIRSSQGPKPCTYFKEWPICRKYLDYTYTHNNENLLRFILHLYLRTFCNKYDFSCSPETEKQIQLKILPSNRTNFISWIYTIALWESKSITNLLFNVEQLN